MDSEEKKELDQFVIKFAVKLLYIERDRSQSHAKIRLTIRQYQQKIAKAVAPSDKTRRKARIVT